MFTSSKNSKCNSRKTHSKEEENIKSPALSTLRKDPNPNQDKKTTGIKKYQCLTPAVPPFISGNKWLLNEENDDNPETTDTSLSEEYYTSHTKRDDYIAKFKDTKNTNDDNKYKEDTSKHQDSNESVDNTKTSDTFNNESVINTIKKEEAWIKRLITMNIKLHVIQYEIDIVTLCGEKWHNWKKIITKYHTKINCKYLILFH